MEAWILRRREVEGLTQFSKAAIYRKMQAGTFPLLLRRSHKSRVSWEGMTELLRRHRQPSARVLHSIYAT